MRRTLMCIELTTEREKQQNIDVWHPFFRVYCLLPARECLARCHKYEIYTFLISLYVMYPYRKAKKKAVDVTFNTFWSTQLKNCAIKALHKIKISAKWTTKATRTEQNERAQNVLGHAVVFMCVYNWESHLNLGREGVEECGIKAIHVILTFFFDFLCKNKLDRNRHVIEQKLWKTEKVQRAKKSQKK